MEKENRVSIWLGNFDDQTAFEDYLQETYNEEDDMSSHFTDDFGIPFYDVDFSEAYFDQKGLQSKILNEFSYADTFKGDVNEALFAGKNAIVVIYDFDYKGVGEVGAMRFLGRFSFER
ncbi:immunity 22 family protein [Flavobacterium sp.]|uniref:immunity 22 family protein n=1 Tax=Flavobacterium sp. TaxID=239 RepID=UPI00120D3C90|nr:immunity 22 family protein [Flavobacterium sp.]RZJ69525.1 MAG: hypothetical protein EOO49_17030 [Flavobacterium sp.]